MLGMHHLHQRRKRIVEESSTVRSVLSKAKIDLLIYVAAFVGPLALLPQVLKLYASHDASGLALSTWVMFGLLNSLWIFYGRKHKEKPIIITNSILMVLNFAIAVGIVLFS